MSETLTSPCCSGGKCSSTSSSSPVQTIIDICCDICRLSGFCCGTGCCLISCCLGKAIQSLPIPRSVAQSIAAAVDEHQKSQHENKDTVVHFWTDPVDDYCDADTDSSGVITVQSITPFSPSIHNITSGTRTCRFSVEGLTCADCSLLVETTLAKHPGVLSSRVSCITHESTVEYDPALASPPVLADIINGTGFTARIIRDDATEDALRGGREDHLRVILQVYAPIPSISSVSATLTDDQVNDIRTALSHVVGVTTVGDTSHIVATVPNRLIHLPGWNSSRPHSAHSSTDSTTSIVRTKAVELEIEYHATKTGPRSLLDVVIGLGYWAHVPSMSELASRNRSDHGAADMWKYRVPLGIILGIPMIFLAFIIPTGALGRSADDALDTEVIPGREGLSVRALLSFLLTTPIQFYVGSPLFSSAYRAAWYSKTANIDTLVVISSSVAYFYSIAIIVSKLAGAQLADHDFFEAPAILITLIVLGRWLEAISKGKASDSVRKLASMQATSALWLPFWKPESTPDTCGSSTKQTNENTGSCCSDADVICTDGSSCGSSGGITAGDPSSEFELDLSLIHRGDFIKVVPGSKVPTDGVVVDGSSSVDESSLTGESMPVVKSIGSFVYGGTINGQGVIYVQVTKAASENMLASISTLVRQAQASKPDAQQFADRLAARFVPFILLLSLSIFLIWLGVGYGGKVPLPSDMSSVTFALQFALSTLVVSCPCAIGLAVPTAIMVATGIAAKHGILFKGGVELEMTHRINAIVFDKTGTLTLGRPSVAQSIIFPQAGHLSNKTFQPLSSSASCKPSSSCCGAENKTLSSPTSSPTGCVASNVTATCTTTCSTKPSNITSDSDIVSAIPATSSSCCKLPSVSLESTAPSSSQCCIDISSSSSTSSQQSAPVALNCSTSSQNTSTCCKPKPTSAPLPADCSTQNELLTRASNCSKSEIALADTNMSSTTASTTSSGCCKPKPSVDDTSAKPFTSCCKPKSKCATDSTKIPCCKPPSVQSATQASCEPALSSATAPLTACIKLDAPSSTPTSNCSSKSLTSTDSCCKSKSASNTTCKATTDAVCETSIDTSSSPPCSKSTSVCAKSPPVSSCTPPSSSCDQPASCCTKTPSSTCNIATPEPQCARNSGPSSCLAAGDECKSLSTILVPMSTSFNNGLSMADFWLFAGSAEQESEHPIAASIVSYARQWLQDNSQSVTLQRPTDFIAIPGKGIMCSVAGHSINIGNRALMDSPVGSSCDDTKGECCNPSPNTSTVEQCVPKEMLLRIEEMESSGQTVVYMSVDGVVSGVIGVADVVRPEARLVVQSLKNMGIDVWMMSGDQPRTAIAVARTLGVSDHRVFGGLLPADKAAKVAELQSQGKIVAMVGDGVNDSPALAQANVGIGMASGTDVAMESAHVVLVKSNLHDVLTAIDLSRVTFRRIRFNFMWAFMYNVVGIVLAAGTFYTVGNVSIPPAFAGLSELLSSLPVVLFSLLLKSYKPPF